MFSQTPGGRLELAALQNSARRFFEATLEVLEERGLVPNMPDTPTSSPFARLKITSARHAFSATFRVVCRQANAEDWAAAREAEVRGRATGMSLLAARCEGIWEVQPESPESKAALLNLSAILASVALGPVLPEDGSTLYGVRGAMERLETLTR